MENDNLDEDSNPEIDTYRTILDKAIRDGNGDITDTKAQILIKLRDSLSISETEHKKIMTELMAKYEERKLATYRSAIKQALTDERLSADEESILKVLRETMKINEEQHNKIVDEIKSEIDEKNIAEAQPELDSKLQEELSDENDSYFWVRKGELTWITSGDNINKALKALTYFDKALELDETNYLAWANKGLILKTLEKVGDALLCYNRALRINPEYATVWYNKGVLLGSIGNFTEAIKAFDNVLELNPDHEFARRDRAILLNLLSKNELDS
jgi:tetratricopeptide (TPR) repeat protein